MMMKIFQFNCTSIRNKSNNIEQYLHDNNFSIGCLSETFLMPHDNIKFKNFEILRSDRAFAVNRGGGVAILIKKSIPFKKINIISNLNMIEVCGCEVNSNIGSLAIFSFYIPPRVNFSVSQLNNIISSTSCRNILICGDFNAHNVSWGSRSTDPMGSTLMDFVDFNNLFILNNGDTTYCGSTPSCIDVSLCSPNISFDTSWSVKNECLQSTHRIIKICINISPSLKFKNPFFVPKTIDKSVLNKKIKDIFNSSHTGDDLTAFDSFSKLFFDNFKRSNKSKSRPPNPWWNSSCNKASACLRRAVSIFVSDPSPLNYNNLTSEKKSYKYTIRSEKNKGWRTFCESIDSNMSVSELWKVVKCFKGSFSQSLAGFKECIDIFCKNLAGPVGPVCLITPRPSDNNHLLIAPFNSDELDKAIFSSKNSSPGIDGLRNEHIKCFNNDNKLKLLTMFNEVLSTGNIPMCWFDYKIMPLKKKMVFPLLHQIIGQSLWLHLLEKFLKECCAPVWIGSLNPIGD